jgi:elongation factor P
VNKLEKGDVFKENNKYLRVEKTFHSKQARSGAVVTIDAEEMGGSGKGYSKKFRSNDSLEVIDVDSHTVRYKPKEDGDIYETILFEDVDTSEEYSAPRSMLVIDDRFINEIDLAKMEIVLRIDSDTNEPIDVYVVSPSVVCNVVETTAGRKSSDRASPITKKATLDNGLSVTVPNFIEGGDKILVKLQDATYMGRAVEEEQ